MSSVTKECSKERDCERFAMVVSFVVSMFVMIGNDRGVHSVIERYKEEST